MKLEFEKSIGKNNTFFKVYAQYKYSLSSLYSNKPNYRTGDRELIAELTTQPHTVINGNFRLLFINPNIPLSGRNLKKISKKLRIFNFELRVFFRGVHRNLSGW